MILDAPPVIRVAHLTKRFGAQVVVDDLSFEVAAGETLVLLGPSGCGKTTLLKTLNRLIEPDGGTIELNGRDVRQQRPEALRRGIGYVIQQVGLLPHYTVAQNVGVVPGLLGQPPAAIAARTTALLDRLHLPAARFAHLLPAQLSGGQQQRVGLARALAADPPVVLLDEPFGALDPITRAAVRRDFRELDELRRKTVVLVTHDVTEAFELADRILLLNQGRIQQLGPPRELLLRPANDFVRRFFQAERLALQLRVLTLAEVLPYLPAPAPPPVPAGAPLLPLTASLWEALELLSAEAPAVAFPLSTSLAEPLAVPPAPTGPSPRVPGTPPAPVGAAPTLTGTAPALAGTAPAFTGTAPALAGTAPAFTGTAPALAGTAPALAEAHTEGLVKGAGEVAPANDYSPAAIATLLLALPTGPALPVTLPQLLAAFGQALLNVK